MNDFGNKLFNNSFISEFLFAYLSGRAISTAIDSLIQKNLITVTNESGQILKNKNTRRGVSRLYYSSNSLLEESQEKNKASEITFNNPVNKVHTIKQTIIKQSCENTSQGKIRLSDRERILQIINSKN